LHRSIGGCIDVVDVLDMVPGCHVLEIILVYVVGVLDAVVVYQRVAVDVRFLGDDAGFGGS
jgi:hypothetical protein